MEIGKFAPDRKMRFHIGIYIGQFIDQPREKGHLGRIIKIKSIHGIVDGFIAIIGLMGLRLFVHVQKGSANLKLVVEFMFDVQTRKTFGLLTEQGIVFGRYTDGDIGGFQRFVDDFNPSQLIIYGIIYPFLKFAPTGSDLYRAPWHVEGSDGNSFCSGRFIGPDQFKFILIGVLLVGLGFGFAIERSEYIFLLVIVIGIRIVIFFSAVIGISQFFKQMFTKRLDGRKYQATVLFIYRESGHIIKKAVSPHNGIAIDI